MFLSEKVTWLYLDGVGDGPLDGVGHGTLHGDGVRLGHVYGVGSVDGHCVRHLNGVRYVSLHLYGNGHGVSHRHGFGDGHSLQQNIQQLYINTNWYLRYKCRKKLFTARRWSLCNEMKLRCIICQSYMKKGLRKLKRTTFYLISESPSCRSSHNSYYFNYRRDILNIIEHLAYWNWWTYVSNSNSK